MRKQRLRKGFSLLELQVAFVVFAIAVAGLGPLVVMQSKHLKKIEDRFNDQSTYYLGPSSDEWARKLGAGASLKTQDPGPPPAPLVVTIDDGDPDFSTVGSGWELMTSVNSFQGDHNVQTGGDGSKTATWQFNGLIPGWYDVRLTWLETNLQATNAPFTVYDGAVSKGTFAVNQQVAPVGAVFGGRPWQSLGVFPITSDTLKVHLSNNAIDNVIADGVRLVPVQNDVRVTSLNKSITSEEVTVHVSVTVLVPQ